VRASRVAASYGARVAIAECGRFGGTCVNVGCIPKKLFAYAAHYREDFEVAKSFGWTLGEPRFDWQTLLANKDREIARLNGVYENLLATAGVAILRARATVVDPHTVEVAGRRYTARHILVATGSWPQVPSIPGRERAITSNEAFFLETLPRRALVVGGGYIALEFASIFNGLGVETTLAYRGPRLLRGFDPDLGGRILQVTAMATADQLAATAGLEPGDEQLDRVVDPPAGARRKARAPPRAAGPDLDALVDVGQVLVERLDERAVVGKDAAAPEK